MVYSQQRHKIYGLVCVHFESVLLLLCYVTAACGSGANVALKKMPNF